MLVISREKSPGRGERRNGKLTKRGLGPSGEDVHQESVNRFFAGKARNKTETEEGENLGDRVEND